MQQTERIELIKAAVELTKLFVNTNNSSDIDNVTNVFDSYYDYLQSKIEGANVTANT